LKEHEVIERSAEEILIKKGDFAYPKEGIYKIQNSNTVNVKNENGEMLFNFNKAFKDNEIIFKN
jgi:hypothetical protein